MRLLLLLIHFPPTSIAQNCKSTEADFLCAERIGHCGAHTNGDGRVFAYDDPAASDDAHVWAPYAKMAKNCHRADGTRLVFQLREAVCTVAYAISNQGARKMEKAFEDVNQPVDLEMLKQW